MTEWESHLRSMPVREVPPHWRAEILAAAAERRRTSRRAGWSGLSQVFRGLLWPHPTAWAVLAACWLVAAVLCFWGPRGPSLYVVTPPDLEPVEVIPESYAFHRRMMETFLKEGRISEPSALDRSKL